MIRFFWFDESTINHLDVVVNDCNHLSSLDVKFKSVSCLKTLLTFMKTDFNKYVEKYKLQPTVQDVWKHIMFQQESFEGALAEIDRIKDCEDRHSAADDLLVEQLELLGFNCEKYNKMQKWYA